ncbi:MULTISPECIES: DUF6706 family protein [Bacillaceae]|uniref:Phage protein n=1 Tax=Evansella alkalicola TaxID=745819 RepID=A0ABS6JR07_9BACI|nr:MULTISPECIES: DUF6706 family protein [Bacillaceae]MBU9720541.1 hypothetical protein [Bacillus alkalicola]
MTNLQRLEMEIKGINLSQNELQVYLLESNLTPHTEYNPESKKAIYQSALSILESIANQPSLMKSYKYDDMTVSDFAEHIQSRIDQLERKIRQMKTSEEDTSFFMLFNG